MAYISKEEVRIKRNVMRKALPKGWKISVVRKHYSLLKIAFLQAPVNLAVIQDLPIQQNFFYHGDLKNLVFGKDIYKNNRPFNISFLSNEDRKVCIEFYKVLKTVSAIAKAGWYDRSDIMIDYFNVAYYIDILIGREDKPFLFYPQ